MSDTTEAAAGEQTGRFDLDAVERTALVAFGSTSSSACRRSAGHDVPALVAEVRRLQGVLSVIESDLRTWPRDPMSPAYNEAMSDARDVVRNALAAGGSDV